MGSEKLVTEIWPHDTLDKNYGVYIVVISTVLFYLFGKLSLTVIPTSARQASWRWKNTCVSFCHSCVSGIWVVLCFYESPKMAEDMISTWTTSSHSLISFSVGYFMCDLLDMIANSRTRQSFELIGHHIVVITCFMVGITTRLYVGYSVVALVVELNSIFLHLRLLMQICGFPKNNPVYRLNSLVNLGTFIVFRISTLAWMTRWIVINKNYVPLVFYSLGSIGLAVMTVMNIILFCRCLRSDFTPKKDAKSKNE